MLFGALSRTFAVLAAIMIVLIGLRVERAVTYNLVLNKVNGPEFGTGSSRSQPHVRVQWIFRVGRSRSAGDELQHSAAKFEFYLANATSAA